MIECRLSYPRPKGLTTCRRSPATSTIWRSASVTRAATASIELAAIKAFAAAFDPQPFHLDEAAAKASIFGRLVASGWHTMALTMRLLVEGELRSLWGLVGLGADELRWPRPVFPGDVLRVEWEVLEVRPSLSKADRGTARLRVTTRNQRGEVVLTLITTILLPRRPPT